MSQISSEHEAYLSRLPTWEVLWWITHNTSSSRTCWAIKLLSFLLHETTKRARVGRRRFVWHRMTGLLSVSAEKSEWDEKFTIPVRCWLHSIFILMAAHHHHLQASAEMRWLKNVSRRCVRIFLILSSIRFFQSTRELSICNKFSNNKAQSCEIVKRKGSQIDLIRFRRKQKNENNERIFLLNFKSIPLYTHSLSFSYKIYCIEIPLFVTWS